MTSTPVGRPLGVLESSGLVRLAATQPELEYLFRHVLVQDAAYESLLKQERRRLHVAVAEAIQDLHPDTSDELAGMLAWHFDAAGESDRALDCYIRAGNNALRRFANDDAFTVFTRARALVDASDASRTPDFERRRVEVAIGLVRSGWLSRPTPEMEAIIGPAVELAETIGDKKLNAQAHLLSAIVAWQQGDLYEPGTKLQRRLDRALALADELGDGDLRGIALGVLGRSSLLTRDPKRAAEVLEEGFELTKGADFIGASMSANTLAMVYGFMGDFERAGAAVRRAVDLADASGDPIAITDAGIAASMVESERGNVEGAVTMARASAARAAELNAPFCTAFSNLIVGTNEIKLGRFELARPPIELSQGLAEAYSIGAWLNQANAAANAVSCAAGNIEAARVGWDKTILQARALHDPGMEADIRVQRASSLLAAGEMEPAAVLSELDDSLRLYEGVGARPRIEHTLRESADVLDRLGRPDEAGERRRRADALRAEMGLPVLDRVT